MLYGEVKIMVKINEYKTYEGSDCFLGCIQNYLLLYQNLVDECNIFFEGNEIGRASCRERVSVPV